MSTALGVDVAHARLGIIGLGDVGLLLAVEFGRRSPTLGYDVFKTSAAIP